MAARYLAGDTNPVNAPVATAKAVAHGDLIGLASNTLVTAADQAWDTNLATTQTNFAALFLGTSAQVKLANQVRPYGNTLDNRIRVNASGDFEIDCDSATYNVGEFVGAAKHPTNNALLADKVTKVATANLAVAQVIETTGANSVKVRVRLLSRLARNSG